MVQGCENGYFYWASRDAMTGPGLVKAWHVPVVYKGNTLPWKLTWTPSPPKKKQTWRFERWFSFSKECSVFQVPLFPGVVDVPSYISRHQRASSGKLWKRPPTKAMFVRVSEVWKIHHWKRHFLMENVEEFWGLFRGSVRGILGQRPRKLSFI